MALVPTSETDGNLIFVLSRTGDNVLTRMTKCTQSADDSPNTYDGANEITLGESVTGTINYAGDTDSFMYTAEADGEYIIDYYSSTDESTVVMKNSSGEFLIQTNDFEQQNSYRIGYHFKAGDVFYIYVTSQSENASYSFDLSFVPEFRALVSLSTVSMLVTLTANAENAAYVPYTMEVYDPGNTLIHVYCGETRSNPRASHTFKLDNPKSGTYQTYISFDGGYMPYYQTFDYIEASEVTKIKKSYVQTPDYDFSAEYNNVTILNNETGSPEAVKVDVTVGCTSENADHLNNTPKSAQLLATFNDLEYEEQSMVLLPETDFYPGVQKNFTVTLPLPADYTDKSLMLCVLNGKDVYAENVKPLSEIVVYDFADGASLMSASAQEEGHIYGGNLLAKGEDPASGEEYRKHKEILAGSGTASLQSVNSTFYSRTGTLHYDLKIISDSVQKEHITDSGSFVKVKLNLTNTGYADMTNLKASVKLNSENFEKTINIGNLDASDSKEKAIDFNIPKDSADNGFVIAVTDNTNKLLDINIPHINRDISTYSNNTSLGTSATDSYDIEEKTEFEGEISNSTQYQEMFGKFTPEEDGFYVIRADGIATVNAKLYPISNLSSPVDTDEDPYVNGYEMITYLTKGTDYILKTMYNPGGNTGEYIIKVEKMNGTADPIRVKRNMGQTVQYLDGTEWKQVYEMNAGNVVSTVSTNGTGLNEYGNHHYINRNDVAGKIIALSLVDGYKFSASDYMIDYLGLKTIDSDGNFVDIENGLYSNDINGARTRFVKIPDNFTGNIYSYIGLARRYPNQQNKPIENVSLKYNESVKILDVAEFETYDAMNNPVTSSSSDSSNVKRDYFISSAPERISNESLFTSDNKQFITRAPINGNSRIYWHHINNTGRLITYAVMLENTSSVDLKVTLNSRNYTKPGDFDGVNLNLYTEVWDENGIENDMTVTGQSFNMSAGERKWICAYGMEYDDTYGGLGSNGVINLSIKSTDNILYYGQNMLCTTYAFDYDAENLSIYNSIIANEIISDSNVHYETATDMTGMRGSGVGAIMEVDFGDINITYDIIKNIAFSGVALPDLEGDRVLLTRYGDTKDDILIIGEDFPGSETNPEYLSLLMTYDAFNDLILEDEMSTKKAILSKYVNYGVVYKIKFNNLSLSNVVGKVKLTPRVHGAMLIDEYMGLHINIWKYDSSGNQITKIKTILRQDDNYLIHPDASKIDGYDIIFDENIPQGQNEYYVAICGMSTLPYEISFENY